MCSHRYIETEANRGQPMDYYPYGEPWVEWDWTLADTYPTFNKNRFLYGGKERITQFGLGLYNFEARMYRAPLGRFSTPDKKAIDTPWLSPFAYCACNPINLIDPTGMIWEDPKDAQRLSDTIDKRIKSCNDEVAKLNEKLKRTDLSQKNIDKYNNQIADLNDQIGYLEMSKSDIELLGNDQDHIYAFQHIEKGGAHKVYSGSSGNIIIQTSNDATAAHEIAHIRQSLESGGLQFYKGELQNPGIHSSNYHRDISFNEIQAYKIQYSVSDSSLPKTAFSINQINVDFVGSILNTDGKFAYPKIYEYSQYLNDQRRNKIVMP